MSTLPNTEILMDELLDGWLSAPSITNFLAEGSALSTRKSLVSATETDVSYRLKHASPVNAESNLATSGQSNSPVSKRRGYSKSRLGCINCKKRKIKCQETWPSCANCTKRGFVCRYPTMLKPLRNERITAELLVDGSLHTLQPSTTPNTFSANDMLLFHYYLTSAYPHIPDGYDNFWIKEVAIFSHQHTYLMHAILAMSASHLALCHDDPRNINVALLHRHKAILGLEEAFSRWPTVTEEAHVMFAASTLLATQSNYMSDGFLDSILSQRGCALISQKILEKQLKGVFTVAADFDITSIEVSFRNFPNFDQDVAREALRSIARYAPLLTSTSHSIERDITAQIAETVRQLLVPVVEPDASNDHTHPGLGRSNTTERLISSSLSTPSSDVGQTIKNPYIPFDLSLSFEDIPWETIASVPPPTAPSPRHSLGALTGVLLILFTWPPDSILHLFSQTNKVGNIVLAHVLAVRFAIPALATPRDSRAMKTPLRTAVDWLAKVIDTVEDDAETKWNQYLEWPKKIQRCLQHSLLQKKALNYSDLADIVVNDPRAFLEGRARRIDAA